MSKDKKIGVIGHVGSGNKMEKLMKLVYEHNDNVMSKDKTKDFQEFIKQDFNVVEDYKESKERTMSNEEMIEAIKSNYPSSNYTMLREALDYSMELLKRDTPMKMIESKEYKGFYDCECHSAYKFKESNFCGYCGKEFDWSDK